MHNAGLVEFEERRDSEGAHPSENALSHPMSYIAPVPFDLVNPTPAWASLVRPS